MIDLSKFVDKKVKVTFASSVHEIGWIRSHTLHNFIYYNDSFGSYISGLTKEGNCANNSLNSIVEIEEFNKIQELEEKVNELQKEIPALRLEESKTEIEKAYKKAYGNYPGTADEISELDAIRWEAFEKGWNAA